MKRLRWALSWMCLLIGSFCNWLIDKFQDAHGRSDSPERRDEVDDLLGGVYLNDEDWHAHSSVTVDVLGTLYQKFMTWSSELQGEGFEPEDGPWRRPTPEELEADACL